MPDTVSALDAILKIPNLGLCSLAGNLSGCEVRVMDLAFKGRGLDRLLASTLDEFEPDVVGLSAQLRCSAATPRGQSAGGRP
jgi:hypothetical protein